QLFFLDQPALFLHRRQQRAFVVARRWLGLLGYRLEFAGQTLPLGKRRQRHCSVVSLVVLFLLTDLARFVSRVIAVVAEARAFLPARRRAHPATGHEAIWQRRQRG